VELVVSHGRYLEATLSDHGRVVDEMAIPCILTRDSVRFPGHTSWLLWVALNGWWTERVTLWKNDRGDLVAVREFSATGCLVILPLFNLSGARAAAFHLRDQDVMRAARE
jgi:hypothetical protein